MKAIVYSLFGYGRESSVNCFDFQTYLRTMMLNLRMNHLLYPDWITVVETDKITYEEFRMLFDYLKEKNILLLEVNEDNTPLCRAMLWRLQPVFWKVPDGRWQFTHVLCRDLDSPATYREVQAVNVWVEHDKAMHAITDSISHNVALMGGMIGCRPDYFTERISANTFETMIKVGSGIDYSKKNADQIFLNTYIYPFFAQYGNDSITQHYFSGHAKTFLSDFHTCICEPVTGHTEKCPNNTVIFLPDEYKESNGICGHIGSAGYYEGPIFRFLSKHWHKFNDLIEIEMQYPKYLFYWNWRKDLSNE